MLQEAKGIPAPWWVAAIGIGALAVAWVLKLVKSERTPDKALAEVERKLTEVRDRLQWLATREDLAEAAKENRHATGEGLQKLMTVMIEVQMELTRLAGKLP